MAEWRRAIAERLEASWYPPARPYTLLAPLTWLFAAVSAARRFAYRHGWLSSWRAPVPVIVVGNINVGGSGKTPIVIALINALQNAGYSPGVISRGYGGVAPVYPLAVDENTSPDLCGDEPALIARRCHIPVAVGPDRVAAANFLLATTSCNVIISDDGLQHYALQRDIELVVMDAQRGVGNGFLLPRGPLREPLSRLQTVFAILLNGAQASQAVPGLSSEVPVSQLVAFSLRPDGFVQLSTAMHSDRLPAHQRLAAVAGIGNPDRFFAALENQDLRFDRHPFPDHYRYRDADLAAIDADLILMTEKDAVKCLSFNDARLWYQPVSAQLPEQFIAALLARLRQI